MFYWNYMLESLIYSYIQEVCNTLNRFEIRLPMNVSHIWIALSKTMTLSSLWFAKYHNFSSITIIHANCLQNILVGPGNILSLYLDILLNLVIHRKYVNWIGNVIHAYRNMRLLLTTKPVLALTVKAFNYDVCVHGCVNLAVRGLW